MVPEAPSPATDSSVNSPLVERYIRFWKELETEKRYWLIHYQALAEIFLTRKQDFLRTIIPGAFLQDNVFDNTGQFAAYLMASVFLSMMWPEGERTFRLRPARRLRKVKGVEEYFQFCTQELHEAMDNPKAGLSVALMEHFLDLGIFGTSGIACFEGPEDDAQLPVVYDAWDVKCMSIAENQQGFVNVIAYVRQRTARQIVEEFSRENDSVHSVVSQYAKSADHSQDKFDVLHFIEMKLPEEIRAAKGKVGIAGMAVRSVHIDITNKHLMREGGFEEMPVYVARLFKALNEVYGRSSGMLALPDAVSLNVLTEGVLVATEKQLDPPLVVLDSGRLGGGVVDTSAGGLNVYDTSGHVNPSEKPLFPLYTVNEMTTSKDLQARLTEKIMQAFFLDRLLDLNNKTVMTAYETSVRNKMRGEALGAIFSREEKEVFTPLIQRTFNILYRRGQLGVVKTGSGARLRARWKKILGADEVLVPPEVIAAAAEGLDVFEVEYVSPAKRFMRAEKLQSLFTATDAIAGASQVMPGAVDNVDPDKWARDVWFLAGASEADLRTQDELETYRQGLQRRQAAAEQADHAEKMAGTMEKVARARQMMGTSMSPMLGGEAKGGGA